MTTETVTIDGQDYRVIHNNDPDCPISLAPIKSLPFRGRVYQSAWSGGISLYVGDYGAANTADVYLRHSRSHVSNLGWLVEVNFGTIGRHNADVARERIALYAKAAEIAEAWEDWLENVDPSSEVPVPAQVIEAWRAVAADYGVAVELVL